MALDASVLVDLPEHGYARKQGFTMKRILLKLDKLKCTVFPNGCSPRLITPPTKILRDIYAFLGFSLPACIG